ncbi:hypothetical protein [Frigoribacterium sp. NPDC087798]|uniref:hypothetical protein n=1 Tax=Frigoribacterium sp. NPDC087798 TaxID=3363993 RepID=UPI00382202E1
MPSSPPTVPLTSVPTPSHIVVDLMTHGSQAATAPWWGVPAIAGGFLIVGGFLTFIFTQVSEKKKYVRERTDRETKEVVGQGAELLTAGNKVRDIALLGLKGTVTDFARRLAKDGKPALESFVLASNRFRLVVPLELRGVFEKYLATTMTLFVPPFTATSQEIAIRNAAQASNDMLDALRTHEGRKPFNIAVGKFDVREKAAASTSILIEEMIRETNDQDQSKEQTPQDSGGTAPH